MKRLFLITMVLIIACPSYAADTAVGSLTECSDPQTTDEMYINDGGTGKKVQVGNLPFTQDNQNETITGFWSVKYQEVVKTTTDTLTAAECSGTVINNYGQSSTMTLTLPTAAKGLKFLYVIGTAGQTSHIKAGASDKIYLDGTALDDADKVSNNGASSVVGEQIVFYTFQTGSSTYDWIAQTVNGVFSDGGA